MKRSSKEKFSLFYRIKNNSNLKMKKQWFILCNVKIPFNHVLIMDPYILTNMFKALKSN